MVRVAGHPYRSAVNSSLLPKANFCLSPCEQVSPGTDHIGEIWYSVVRTAGLVGGGRDISAKRTDNLLLSVLGHLCRHYFCKLKVGHSFFVFPFSRWLAEKGARLEKIFQMNLAVRDDWQKSIELKRLRDYEEKLFKR